MMRIAFLSGNALDYGGVEAYLLAHLRHRDPNRQAHWVMATSSPRFRDEIVKTGTALLTWRAGFPVDLTATRRVASWLHEHRVDLIHTQDLRSTLVGAPAAKARRVPMVRTVHMPEFFTARGNHPRARLRRRYYTLLEYLASVHLADRVIFVSSQVRERAVERRLAPRARSVVIPNGVELDDFNLPSQAGVALRGELGTEADRLVLTFIGRLDPQKGVDVLLEALALLPLEQPFELWIAGDGGMRPSLEALAAERGLHQVRFLGWRMDIPELLCASDLFVLPSRFEGMSITLLEAMAAGLPCVVTAVGEGGKLVQDAGCGLVVQPEDPHALAAALRQLAHDEALRIRMRTASRRAAQPFDSASMAERTAAIYDDLLRQDHS